ncbi:hypothetical protein PFFVO_00887 [Plasmodium falciparum Vietnam Oak-Knoll (FVO)]|uniref:Surface antigen n=1 Tax=Plasmodium falciparum Vietnam Oak-Knoll (FVO) TaxID=1036723 RepID=A0A024VB67_PLAFA|nr:hypothetical protein PFFVO_00887 [Plasmodium falciparum Vietnam Oak-Knoll (FVO)]
MKVHYINILLFALPLNILARNNNKSNTTQRHTQTNRSLCECDTQSSIYDNDPEMKKVIQQFEDRTSQRFHEYDERMKNTRQKCKDKCDKEIQKIILKDKIEKQMAQQLTTLETKITTEDIPTCICEKSLADKAEKFCLNCSKNMGAIAPWWGLVCGVGYAGWTHYVPIAVAKAATDAGINVVIEVLKMLGVQKVTTVIFKEISRTGQYANIIKFSGDIYEELTATCAAKSSTVDIKLVGRSICSTVQKGGGSGVTAESVSSAVTDLVGKATLSANDQAAKVTAKYTSTTSSLTNTIIASIIAIVVIVLIMVIIYLILRYRRKKKMKKKLQYIKLLEE